MDVSSIIESDQFPTKTLSKNIEFPMELTKNRIQGSKQKRYRKTNLWIRFKERGTINIFRKLVKISEMNITKFQTMLKSISVSKDHFQFLKKEKRLKN